MSLVRAEGLRKEFPLPSLFGRSSRAVKAVADVSLAIAKGTTLGLVGESGSGKSTVGRLLLGLARPDAGRVFLGDDEITAARGERLRKLRRRMQMVFQDPYGSLDPRMSAGDAIGEPLEIHRPELSRAERRERVAALLARVGLEPAHAERRPGAFSGGQRQRIVIARALAVEPELVIADEPVSALDVTVGARIVALLRELQQERGLTYLFVSHDLTVVERVSTDVAVMYLGRIVETGPAKSVLTSPRHPYTAALVSAVPGKGRLRQALEGEVPSPLDPPSGCAFHPRCPLRKRLDAAKQRRCVDELPELRTIGGTQAACHFAEETDGKA